MAPCSGRDRKRKISSGKEKCHQKGGEQRENAVEQPLAKFQQML
jgi:hypothetical protein